MAVALSGGIDSVVLLDVLDRAARGHRFQLSALHVNHGISSNAFRWERFCRDLCRSRGVPFKAVRVKVKRARGASLEALARQARYRAFADCRTDFVALAHNRDDQAETLLLQLLRGAGAKGLSAMPVVRPLEVAYPRTARGAPLLLRPLLGVPRSAIEAYARKRKLAWVEDESNADTRLDRNFLRRQVLPVLAGRFPACRAALARAAGHLAEASALLDELARMDAGPAAGAEVLRLAVLRGLPDTRAKNLLRCFLADNGVRPPPAPRLEELLRQLRSAGADSRVRVALGGSEIRCFRGAAHLLPSRGPVPEAFSKRWTGEPRLDLDPLPGVLIFARGRDGGISRRKLTARPVTVRLRRGGERFQPDCRRPRRSLKNLLQESAIPPWERETLPLLFSGDELVWVPGIGVDCGFQARPGEAALRVAWNGSGPESAG